MTSYTVDFARLRARQRNRRDVLEERHSQERAALEAEVAAELAKLDDLERAVVEMVAEKEANPKKPAPAASRGGRKYTADQDAEILATPVKKDLRRLAEKLGRSFEGVEKRRENLLKQQRAAAAAEPRSTPGHPDAESQAAKRSEEAADGGQALDTGEVLRPVDGADSGLAARRSADVAGAGPVDSRERPAPPPRPKPPPADRPVSTITGRLLDNGPADQRIYDTAAFSSPRRDG